MSSQDRRIQPPSQPRLPVASHACPAANLPGKLGTEVPEPPLRDPAKASKVPHRNPTSPAAGLSAAREY